jgi:hypothetical protein
VGVGGGGWVAGLPENKTKLPAGAWLSLAINTLKIHLFLSYRRKSEHQTIYALIYFRKGKISFIIALNTSR